MEGKVKKNSIRGFTIVEMLAVMVVAGILLSLVLGLYKRAKEKTITSNLKAKMAAIELALEEYRAAEGFYPRSDAGWSSMTSYPSEDWVGVAFPGNRLYQYLVEDRLSMSPPQKPYLADVASHEYEGGKLLAPIEAGNGAAAEWHYNSFSPKYNKNTYDLWVQYGDYGDNGAPGGGDDFVKVIKNW